MNLETLRPLKDRLLVRRIDVKTTSSIFIPDIAKDKSTWGIVLRSGPKADTKPGTKVLFGQYYDFEQDDLVLIQEKDIRVVEDSIRFEDRWDDGEEYQIELNERKSMLTKESSNFIISESLKSLKNQLQVNAKFLRPKSSYK